jgi:tellurite resistance protein TehA-like permease
MHLYLSTTNFPFLHTSHPLSSKANSTLQTVSAIYLFRLFQCGFPEPNARPGLFLAVGPPSFTVVAVIKLASDIPANYAYFHTHPTAAETLQIIALFFGLFFWIFAFWFFCLALVAVLMTAPKMRFHMTWCAFVFPNAGFTIATLSIGHQLDCPGMNWVGTGATIIIFCVWMMNNLALLEAIYRGRYLS